MIAIIAAVALCATPNTEAQFRPYDPVIIHHASNVADGTEVDVHLSIDANGRTVAASIVRSSKDADLDQAAIDWAKRDTFKPKIIDCGGVASDATVHLRYYAPWKDLLRPAMYTTMKYAQAHPPQRVTQYVRACTPYQTMSDAEFAQTRAKQDQEARAQLERSEAFARASGNPTPKRPSNEDVIAAVEAHDPSARSAHVLVDDLEAYDPHPGATRSKNRSYAVQIDEADGTTRLARATFTPEATFSSLDALSKSELSVPYELSRSMAAWTLLNDLLGGDNPIPRLGCARALKVSTDSPGVGAEIYRALMTTPDRDPAAEQRALDAFRAFAATPDAQHSELTRATLSKLGPSPAITFVYRDRDTLIGTDPEIDIVRISNGGNHTYATLDITSDGKVEMSSPALCLVGDNRCAAYYVWP